MNIPKRTPTTTLARANESKGSRSASFKKEKLKRQPLRKDAESAGCIEFCTSEDSNLYKVVEGYGKQGVQLSPNSLDCSDNEQVDIIIQQVKESSAAWDLFGSIPCDSWHGQKLITALFRSAIISEFFPFKFCFTSINVPVLLLKSPKIGTHAFFEDITQCLP